LLFHKKLKPAVKQMGEPGAPLLKKISRMIKGWRGLVNSPEYATKKEKVEPKIEASWLGPIPANELQPLSKPLFYKTEGSNNVLKSRRRNVREDSSDEDASPRGPILYWMQRDQRVQDNWALLYAQQLAVEKQVPLGVVFCLLPSFMGATMRHYGFMLRSLRVVEQDLAGLGIQFHLLLGQPEDTLPTLAKEVDSSGVVVDFSPMRISQTWKQKVAANLPSHVPICEVTSYAIVCEVDAHNS
jgi:deoxyribodipyrimidine photo-lyase